MKRILKILVPSILMLLLIYLWRNGKDILTGIYIIFPFMYIILGLICSLKELLISLALVTITFLIPINLWFNMGTCVDLVIFYNILSAASYLIKKRIEK